MVSTLTAVNKTLPGECSCRLRCEGTGLAKDLLQAWLADHPHHTRKQHIQAYDIFKWQELRLNGGSAECSH